MSVDLLIISFILITGFGVILLIIKRILNNFSDNLKPSQELLFWLKTTNERLDSQNKQITATLQATTDSMNKRLDTAARFISEVQKNIGEMSEIGRGMKELQEFLRSPKLRGNIGEHILSELLSQMLPRQSFHLQYTFKSGVIVDAAIKTSNGIIPIDSKFPLENFRKLVNAKDSAEKKTASTLFEKDVKKHIDDISKKYILTEEGTIDYALMYIPSESVYYEIINNASLFDYSSSKRVLPVSPMTFYAYLRAILMSFEGQKIEEQAKEIVRLIRAIQKDYLKVDDNLGVLSRHLTNAYNQMNSVSAGFTELGRKLNTSPTVSLNTSERVKQLEIR